MIFIFYQLLLLFNYISIIYGLHHSMDVCHVINDRKELMSWRAERQQRLQQLRAMVFESLGVSNLEFR